MPKIPIEEFVQGLKPSLKRENTIKLLLKVDRKIPVFIENPSGLKNKLSDRIFQREMGVLLR
jgi:hypothetical protein